MNWKNRYTEIKVGDKVRFVKFEYGSIMEEQHNLHLGDILTISKVNTFMGKVVYRVEEVRYRFPKGELEKI